MKKLLSILTLAILPSISFANCVFNTSNMNFGSYQSPKQKDDLLSSSNIAVVCDLFSLGHSFSIKLMPGQSNTPVKRYLTNGKDKLYYNLFLTSGRNTIWGDGSNGTTYFNATTSFYIRPTIFSSIIKNQNVSPGFYTDNISFQMTF